MATILESVVDREVSIYRSARPVVSFKQAKELAAEHGTPLLCFSRSVVRQNYELLCQGLPGVEVENQVYGKPLAVGQDSASRPTP